VIETQKEWYSPAEIWRSFSPHQVQWVIVNILGKQQITWPPEPIETGYTDDGGRARHSSEAPFVTTSMVRAELCIRLQRTGVAGKLLIAEINAGYPYLSYEANQALHYCVGKKRKHMAFVDWQREKRKRENTGIRGSSRKG